MGKALIILIWRELNSQELVMPASGDIWLRKQEYRELFDFNVLGAVATKSNC